MSWHQVAASWSKERVQMRAADFYVLQEADCFVVWAWDGSDARLLEEDGTVIWDWTELPVPNFRELDRQRRDAP